MSTSQISDEFLNNLSLLADDSTATDFIFDHFDTLFSNGQFKEANQDLQNINPDTINTTLLISILCITLAAKSHLPERPTLFEKIKNLLLTREGDRTDRLLEGLC